MSTRVSRLLFLITLCLSGLSTPGVGREGSPPSDSGPPREQLAPRTGSLLLVPNFGSNTVSVVDVDDLAVVQTVPAGPGPGVIAVGETVAYVGHRGSAMILEIRLSDLVVVDTLDLSSHMAFPCGLAIGPGGDLCVVGRRHLFAKETDQAVLVVVRPSRVVDDVVPLPDVQGDTHPTDALFAFKNLGVGVTGDNRAVIPYCRSFQNATGVVIHDLESHETQVLPFDPFADGYFRAGVGISPDGTAWLASWRYVSRIYRVTEDGLGVVASPACPTGIWLYLDIAATSDAGCVAGYGESGTSVVQVQGTSSVCRPTGLTNPAGIARDHLGRIWIAHPATGRIYGYDQGWNLVGSVAVGDCPVGFGDMTGAEALRLPVPNFGACCLGSFCALLTEVACWGSLGTFQGGGTVCDPNPCYTSSVEADASGGPALTIQSPAVGTCWIRCRSTSPAGRSIGIIDIGGRRVRHFTIPAGRTEIAWDLRNDGGSPVPSGRYFIYRDDGEGRARGAVTVLR